MLWAIFFSWNQACMKLLLLRVENLCQISAREISANDSTELQLYWQLIAVSDLYTYYSSYMLRSGLFAFLSILKGPWGVSYHRIKRIFKFCCLFALFLLLSLTFLRLCFCYMFLPSAFSASFCSIYDKSLFKVRLGFCLIFIWSWHEMWSAWWS